MCPSKTVSSVKKVSGLHHNREDQAMLWRVYAGDKVCLCNCVNSCEFGQRVQLQQHMLCANSSKWA
jgi:hypothetical protein